MVQTTTIHDYVSIALGRNDMAAKRNLITIAQRLVERQQEERKNNEVNFDNPQMYRDRQQKAKLMAFKARVADSMSVLTKARTAIGFIEKHLNEMKTALEGLSSASTADERATAAATFDTARGKINAQADGASQMVNYRTINLIGNKEGPDWEGDKLFTPYNRSGSFIQVDGAYLGSDFVIEEADGTVWKRNGEGDTLIQYPADGSSVPTGSEISLDGLTITSYDSATGAITYGGSGSLTGTLTRGGLEVLESEYYSGFADDASVAEALADVEAAITAVTVKGADIKAKSSMLTGNVDMAKEQIAKLEKDIAAMVSANVKEMAANQRAAQLKMTLALNNVNLISAANSGLVENMLSLASTRERAAGIFGMMGY